MKGIMRPHFTDIPLNPGDRVAVEEQEEPDDMTHPPKPSLGVPQQESLQPPLEDDPREIERLRRQFKERALLAPQKTQGILLPEQEQQHVTQAQPLVTGQRQQACQVGHSSPQTIKANLDISFTDLISKMDAAASHRPTRSWASTLLATNEEHPYLAYGIQES